MREEKLYICDFCNHRYSKQDAALECEQKHTIPTKIIKSEYFQPTPHNHGNPKRIKVEFNDGQIAWYELTHCCNND